MDIKNYKITGMTCAACAASIEKAVAKIDGINSANVNFLTETLVVETSEGKTVDSVLLEQAVKHQGYQLIKNTEKITIASVV